MKSRHSLAANGLLAALTLFCLNTTLLGQEGRRQEQRGVIKTIDVTGASITIVAGGGRESLSEKTYSLAPQAEVAVGSGRSGLFQPAQVADLSPGLSVAITLGTDGKTVDGILVEEPVVRGTLKQVDAAGHTLTLQVGAFVRQQPTGELQTITIAPDAEIVVDDGRGRRTSLKEARLADLDPGALATITLSLDRKQARAVLAEGASLYGTVKSWDAASRSLVLTGGAARGDAASEEMKLSVAEDALILLDDGRDRRLSLKPGKAADIQVGALVLARLSADQGRVMQIRLSGPTLSGYLKSTDPEKSTITISIPKGRGEPVEERTITVAKDARIASDGQVSTLANLKPVDNGPIVQLRLSLDQATAHVVTARAPGSR